jgi:hypothetical protein
MTRSILWISSRGPSSFPTGWVALPQPRSRMALAAETRAAAVASFDRIMPTRTLSAVLVWLRAKDRISVSDLAIWELSFFSRTYILYRQRGAARGASLDSITTVRVMREVRHQGLRLPSEVWFLGSALRVAPGTTTESSVAGSARSVIRSITSFRPDIFARRRVDMIHGQIVVRCR